MKDMIKTASVLDTILNILSILLKIAFIAMIVGLCLVAAYFLFDLEVSQVGTGFGSISLGFVTVSLGEGSDLPADQILALAAAAMGFGLMCLFLGSRMLRLVREIFAPMKEGLPFNSIVSVNLKKLALYTCILGLLCQTGAALITGITLSWLKNSIFADLSQVSYSVKLDLSFLLAAGLLLLLSYVFRYGEELQKLSDETV